MTCLFTLWIDSLLFIPTHTHHQNHWGKKLIIHTTTTAIDQNEIAATGFCVRNGFMATKNKLHATPTLYEIFSRWGKMLPKIYMKSSYNNTEMMTNIAAYSLAYTFSCAPGRRSISRNSPIEVAQIEYAEARRFDSVRFGFRATQNWFDITTPLENIHILTIFVLFIVNHPICGLRQTLMQQTMWITKKSWIRFKIIIFHSFPWFSFVSSLAIDRIDSINDAAETLHTWLN